MDRLPSTPLESEFQNIQITSTPMPRRSNGSRSSREPTFLAIKSRRRNSSSSNVTPPAKRRKRTTSNASVISSAISSEMDQLSSTAASLTLSSDSEDSQFIQINKGKKVKMVGKEYTLLRPKSKSSLYAQIILKSPDVEILVKSWVCLYQSSRDDAMSFLLNLLANVMGYQNVNIDYNDHLDYAALRIYLEQHTNKTQEKLICLFRSKSPFAKTFVTTCFAFFQNLVLACDHANILYEGTFHNTLLLFIKEMCKSNNRVILVTICSIAINLYTHFLSVLKRFLNNVNASGSSDSSVLMQRSDCLHGIVETLGDLILKFSTIRDVKLHILHLRVAEEFGVWMKMCPEFFINEQIFHALRKLLENEKTSVRIAALKSCIGIVRDEKFTEYISAHQGSFTKLCNAIEAKLNDITVDVKIMAVQFLTKLSVLYPQLRSMDTLKKIYGRIYSYNYKLARQSGLFCIATLFGNIRQDRMRKILQLDQLPEFESQTELLVHTLIGCTPEFIDVEFIINMIKEDEDTLSSRELVKLLEIIYHIAHILVKEELGYTRSQISVGADTNKMNDYIGGTILKNISFLLTNFSEDELFLVWILKTLNVLDIAQPTFSTYREHIKYLVKYLIEIMKNSLNKTVLSLSSKILSKLSEDSCVYSTQIYAIILIYIDQLITQYERHLYLNREQTIMETDSISMRNEIYVLSIISEHHNCVNMLDWNNIFSDWGSSNPKTEIIKYQIICCQHYLKWKLKNLFQASKEESTEALSLKKCMDDYLTSCAGILENTQRSKSLGISAYLSVCEFFLEYNKIQIQSQDNILIEILGIQMSNYRGLTTAIESFITNYCFNVDVDLLARQTYLIKYVTLMSYGVIPTEKLVLVMKHYHLFKDDYKYIYKRIIDKLNEVNDRELSKLMFTTLLTMCVEKEKPKHIMALSEDFSEIQPRVRHHLIIEMGVNYVVAFKDRLKLILILKPFVQKFSATAKLEMLNYIKSKCPPDYFRDNAFIFFLEGLKLKSVEGKLDRTIHESVRSSTRRSRATCSFNESSGDDTIQEIDDD